MNRPPPACIAAVILATAFATDSASGDSTAPPPAFSVPVPTQGSVIGRTSDGKICRYLSEDGRIHCVYDEGTAREFIARSIVEPDFPEFGRSTRGTITYSEGETFAFLLAEFETRITDSQASTFCRLALRFLAESGQAFWIWHDELRQGTGGQTALVDADGDGLADLAVSGRWDGTIDGTRRWWTPNPFDDAYPAEFRQYPARPAFGSVQGRSLACRPDQTRLALLSEAGANTLPSVEAGYSGILGVQTGN